MRIHLRTSAGLSVLGCAFLVINSLAVAGPKETSALPLRLEGAGVLRILCSTLDPSDCREPSETGPVLRMRSQSGNAFRSRGWHARGDRPVVTALDACVARPLTNDRFGRHFAGGLQW